VTRLFEFKGRSNRCHKRSQGKRPGRPRGSDRRSARRKTRQTTGIRPAIGFLALRRVGEYCHFAQNEKEPDKMSGSLSIVAINGRT
jgi:hypothetical protein